MAWILLCFDVLPTFETREGSPRHAPPQYSISRGSEACAVAACWIDWWRSSKANKKVRRLSTQNQFMALLYAQLAGSESLRAIEAGFESHASKLYHLGACEVSRSTLSDANAQRPCAVFSGLLAELMGRCERALGRRIADAVYLIDSTGFRLSALSAEWARFSAGVSGAKLHIVYNPDSMRPSFAEVTPANVNDITVAKIMPIKAGATYVFDLGYYDYSWWAKLDDAGCRIVTRLKVNTPLAVIAANSLPQGSPHSVRLHRLSARAPGAVPQQPVPRPGPRTTRAHRDWQNPAHPHQRSRCSSRPNRRTLQAPLANRTVLPLDQAHPQNPSLPRHIRKRRAHSDRSRFDRLPAPTHRARPTDQRTKPAHLHPSHHATTSCIGAPSTTFSNRRHLSSKTCAS